MIYTTIAVTIVAVITGILSLLLLHFFFFAVVGIFAKKTYPKTEKKNRYGIIIPARNEEAVVGNLIDSVRKNHYPQDKLTIFVIAHNCTDRTADICRAKGVTVYEYNNPKECTMGYAFRYLFDRIREDEGVENYDGFFLFNADNILSADYFEKMNDAFEACGKKRIITSFRNSKNFGSNLISGMYGLYFMTGCRLESRGRTVLGCSTRVQGTGYVINSDMVRCGWKYVTLTEDWEFTADQILQGNKIEYCDDAVFYDEQPVDFRVMWRQRVRWSKGHLLVCIAKLGELIRKLLRKTPEGEKGIKFSVYDIAVNILPVCTMAFGLFLLNLILLAFVPAFSDNWQVVYRFASHYLLFGAALFYIGSIINAILIFVLERKRIKNVGLFQKILMTLCWPLFLLITTPMELVALFSKNIGWKVIPHNDPTDFETLNKTATAKKDSCNAS